MQQARLHWARQHPPTQSISNLFVDFDIRTEHEAALRPMHTQARSTPHWARACKAHVRAIEAVGPASAKEQGVPLQNSFKTCTHELQDLHPEGPHA